ncbi:MAG: SLBB domain-containing protein [Cyanobacteria bacterium]|nr:SLBB domain-containing protein [Cyanobacteriota bacterium]MDA1020091.1 SLBB domain-containing protein [Cyanobacteriota bacterium]
MAEAPLVSHTNQEHYTIQLDNELTVIYKNESGREIYNKIPVLPNGKATIPGVGEIQVEGLTQEQLISTMESKLESETKVDIIIYRISNNVTVVGAVNNPGSYPIRDIKTIYDAIGKAGGFSITSNKTKVKLIRQRIDGSRDEQNINFPKQVFNAYDKGIGEEKYILKEGDMIWVPHSKLKQSGIFMFKLMQVATIGVISGVVSIIIR